MLDAALEAKVNANKDESKCLKPLIAVNRPVRDRYVFYRVLLKALSSPGGTELEASTALIEWRPHHIHSQGIPHQGLLELPMLSAPDSIHPDLT